jgi:hypothetical protein
MEVPAIVRSIELSSAGEWMRMSLKSMPVVEAIHVLTAAVVFGTILIIDLRLLGFPNTRRAFTRIEHELLRYTWGAFIISVVTGILMFAANASTYYGNTAFRLKMLALLVAGANMAVFEFVTKRGVGSWDKDVLPAPAARFAGAASILIWTAVIVIARWIAWTKGYGAGATIPDNVNFDFSGQ